MGDLNHDGMSAKFCLKWNNFGRNVTSSFKHLLETEDFVDISLSAEGKTLKAHKVVLSASSPYFRELLQDIPYWQHPVVLLRDVPYSDLQGIVEFIYHGEVSVDQENLSSFLKTAQTLRVKGLTEESGASAGATANNGPIPSHSALIHQNNTSAKNVLKSEILTKQQQLQLQQEEEIDDVEDEEEEELEMNSSWTPRVASTNFHNSASKVGQFQPNKKVKLSSQNHHHPRKSANPKRANVLKQQIMEQEYSEESELGIFAGEIDDREEEEIMQQQEQQQQQQTHAAAVAAAAAAMSNNLMAHFMTSVPNARATPPTQSNFKEELENDDGMQIVEGTDEGSGTSSPLGFNPKSNKDGTQKKTCPFCQQQLSWHALSRHIRDMHKNNQQGFVTCKFCGKMFRNKNSLGCHMWRFHKDQSSKKQEQEPKVEKFQEPASIEEEQQ